MWQKIDNGSTIGTTGSEGGIIVLDEEFGVLARITLEKEGEFAPWSITCGVYGVYGGFFHTVFASSQDECQGKITRMKVDLSAIILDEDSESRYKKIRNFTNNY